MATISHAGGHHGLHARTRPACRAEQSRYCAAASTIHSATVFAEPSASAGKSGHGAARSAGGGLTCNGCVDVVEQPVIETLAITIDRPINVLHHRFADDAGLLLVMGLLLLVLR